MSDEATQHNEDMMLTQYIRNHIISKGMCQLVADERSKTFERIENVEDYSFPGRKYIVHAHTAADNDEHLQALVALPQSTINELLIKYRQSQQSDKPKLPRDTQFLQSAKLIYNAMDERDYLWIAEDDEPRVMKLIAQFTYDLIAHVVNETNVNLDVATIEDTVREIPNITKFPNEETS